MKNEYSVLINTTDSFEDCWEPFFVLFKKFWPEYQGKIYLNTETKEYKFDKLNIICIKNNLLNKPWSECLNYALKFIDEENIIYLQEDYFFNNTVNNSLLNSYFNIFLVNNFNCLHLTDQCTLGPFEKDTGIQGVWEICKGASYRLSTQAAFWKKDVLRSLIRNWETGWQFEKFGTYRSNLLIEKIMCVNQNSIVKSESELLPYVFTGIIKGKWKPEVLKLFNENDIILDLNIRGFHQKIIKNPFNLIKITKIIKKDFKSYINLFLLYLKRHLLH
jgi:hypothetical protein